MLLTVAIVIGVILLGVGSRQKTDMLLPDIDQNRAVNDAAKAKATKRRLAEKAENERASRRCATAQSLEKLRDQGIRNVGWVAGNTQGHPIWPQMRPFVGEGGEYYNAFVRIATCGLDDETVAFMNVRLYNEWVEKGRLFPFNEAESMRRTQRSIQIVKEMTKLMRQMRSTPE